MQDFESELEKARQQRNKHLEKADQLGDDQEFVGQTRELNSRVEYLKVGAQIQSGKYGPRDLHQLLDELDRLHETDMISEQDRTTLFNYWKATHGVG